MRTASISASSTAYQATLRKIEAFQALPAGWHYGSGGPLRASSVERARQFLDVYRSIGIREFNAFLSADGDLKVTGYFGQFCIEVDVLGDGTFAALLEQEGEPVRGNAPSNLSEAMAAIRKFSSVMGLGAGGTETWNLSASFISGIMTGGEVNSSISRSRTAAAVAGFPSLKWNVRSPPPAAYASISVSSIRTSPETPRHFGDSAKIRSPMIRAETA